MSLSRILSVRLVDLFTLVDESIQQVPDEHKGPLLSTFCLVLKEKHSIPQADIEEGLRMLVIKDDYRRGLRPSGGVRKEIVATRSVPVSHPEERGENGLWWRDAR